MSPPTQWFEKGLSLFQKGHTHSARSLFEKINRGEDNFVPALVEIQKINYQKNQWDRFFGLALYYRNILLSSSLVEARSNFRQTPLVLEILALIRHCRFKSAQEVKDFSITLAQNLKVSADKIKKTEPFFKLDSLIGDEKKSKPPSLERQIYSWPLKTKQLKWVDNPKNLRVKVQSQC